LKKALVIVDMQNDFMPGGALGVHDADQIISVINHLILKFSLVVASLDWHPADHVSFASSHPGKKIGDTVQVKGFEQVLWPIHCVRETFGAQIVSQLHQEKIAHYFHKGTDRDIDSYSAFFDNARLKSTKLGEYLKEQHVDTVYLVGVATDYCVLYSALDAIDLGFSVYVIADACRAINLHPHDEEHALQAIAAKGGTIITSGFLMAM
jgi:nicotinamidase/pyrazinamidase